LDYLKRILNAKVYDVAVVSSLSPAPELSRRTGNTVLIKREDEQSVFSFKLRGAYNKMAHLTQEQRNKGVIAASSGNHAQGVALSAQKLGCTATIVMPRTTPSIKVDAVRARGANIVMHGDSYTEAYEYAQEQAQREGKSFIHPYDDPDVIAGQGTIGMEILRQHPGKIDVVFVAVGGGGLISGVSAYIKALRPDVRIVAVQAADSDAMIQSLASDERVVLPSVGLFADAIAVKQVGEETLRLCRQNVDESIAVSTDEICAAIKDAYTDCRCVLEPAGAVSIAGMKKYVEATGCSGQTLIAIACGANMNFDRLRFVAERAVLGEGREAILAVTIPEKPGSFLYFCELLGPRSVTEFSYRFAGGSDAHLFVGVEVAHRQEAAQLVDGFSAKGLDVVDLSDNEMAKLHVRHLVGGRAFGAEGERVFRFDFPERPGALMQFLREMNRGWNVTLFHYRNHGADVGRVLVGMQIPAADSNKFGEFLSSLSQRGYSWYDESHNIAYLKFLNIG
jgi:threonine dehydratase